MKQVDFSQWVTNKSIEALKGFNRVLVVLQGEDDWADMLLKQVNTYPFIQSTPKESSQWYIYSDEPSLKSNVNKQTFRNALGTESQFVVFSSDEMNIDALAALSGTLVSGGVLFIVLPKNIQDSGFFKKSFFNQRLVTKVLNDPSVNIIKQNNDTDFSLAQEGKHSTIQTNEVNFSVKEQDKLLEMGCLTQEQFAAVKQIIQVVKGHRNRPLVLTADRGRGKSSALAIACAELFKNTQTAIHIAITTAHRKSLDIFFSQLLKALNIEGALSNALIIDNKLEYGDSSVQFIPADELIKSTSTFHLVITDEAASIPLPLLSQLLDKYHRLVFASTVHGYEGAGRSFTLKFQKQVEGKFPEGKKLHITQPIRWAEDDPLETFIYDLCLLKAEAPRLDPLLCLQLTNKEAVVEFNVVTPQELTGNELLLQQVFAVLVTAHYQTSPNDLRLMIDNENISLITLTYNKQILGVSLLLKEGLVNRNNNTNKAEVKTLLQTNKRRLKNQFIPQSLLTHCGEENSFDYSYLRVMRIAVLPELQGKGLGKTFLSHIEAYAEKNTIDFIGASFGASKELLSFWQKNSYKIARIGFTKDKSSGEHSALLLKVINRQNAQFIENIEHSFYQSFDYLLAEQYQELTAELVWQILSYCPQASLPIINDFDLNAVEDFYTKKRQYSVCAYHLHKWLRHQMNRPFDAEMKPIINKVFQRKSIKSLTSAYGFTGKKAFNGYLIEFVKRYYETNNQ